MTIPVKQSWLDKAKATRKFHITKKKEDKTWTTGKTAKELRRSIGSVSEDILIADWSRSHPEQIESFDYAYEALEFIRMKKNHFDVEDDEE